MARDSGLRRTQTLPLRMRTDRADPGGWVRWPKRRENLPGDRRRKRMARCLPRMTAALRYRWVGAFPPGWSSAPDPAHRQHATTRCSPHRSESVPCPRRSPASSTAHWQWRVAPQPQVSVLQGTPGVGRTPKTRHRAPGCSDSAIVSKGSISAQTSAISREKLGQAFGRVYHATIIPRE